MSDDDIRGYVQGRLPDDWFTEPADVTVDREEVLVRGRVAPPGDGADASAEEGRIARFREDTRDARIGVAQELERRFGRKVAWAVDCGGTSQTFTSLSVPVMTRLRQPERVVLDTLVAAGVARSRSDALGWCVRLVGRNADDWLAELREAMTTVEQVRERGPQ
ncbi:hypothetical protein [Solicola sp. PLA-1-18]|uniref:hypothetical protein n=1 Tax=Solicola sp. PLA-1-18 TaxID=3380532 RepID=UPI003B7B8FC7